MSEDSQLDSLEEAWVPAREAGVVGPESVRSLNEHAKGFIIEDWKKQPQKHFIDLGTGAGIPGILLAIALPSSRWTLIDSSYRRCGFATLAVDALNLGDRVCVEHVRAGHLSRSSETREQFDGATARLFGQAPELAECGLPLLRIGATLVVSVSDKTEQLWRQSGLREKTGCKIMSSWSTSVGSFLAVQRMETTPSRLPRSAAARQRAPLF